MIQLIGIIVLILVFIWLQLKVYVYFWNRHLDVELKFDSTDMFAGDVGYLKEVITNDKWLEDNGYRFIFRDEIIDRLN